MDVVGICRFSLVGRGDWKAFEKYRGKRFEEVKADVEAIAQAQAEKLFAPARMRARLATFEHLTLASLRAQTDQDFTFVVLASKLMPKRFRERLQAMCDTVPQVKLRFFDMTDAGSAQNQVFKELGLNYVDVLQVRLDDDDCVCADFIEIMKRETRSMMTENEEPFSACIRNVVYTGLKGNMAGVYFWPVAFFSAGAAVRHRSKSIYQFGHFALGNRFPNVVIEGRAALVTNNGTNDTNFTPRMFERRGIVPLDKPTLEELVATNFPFLTDQGRTISGLNLVLAPATVDHSD